MEKKVIRLDEGQLHEMISRTLNEMLGKLAGPDAQGPSSEEEEFEHELYSLIDEYADTFLARGYSKKDFYKWCCEIISNVLR